jgi:hypothetical protein
LIFAALFFLSNHKQWRPLNRSATAFSRNRFPVVPKLKKAILGAIILDNTLVAQSIEMLKPADFYVPSHRRIFTAMIALFERGSEINPNFDRRRVAQRQLTRFVGWRAVFD